MWNGFPAKENEITKDSSTSTNVYAEDNLIKAIARPEDFIELKNSVEKLISVIEKYKNMRYNSSLYIDDLKGFLADVNLILKEKK